MYSFGTGIGGIGAEVFGLVKRRDLPSSLCSRNGLPVRKDEKSQGETELQLRGVRRDEVGCGGGVML